MTPIDQRYFSGPLTPFGDCMRACIASIFDLDLDEAPHFVEWERLHGTPEARIGIEVYTKLRNWAWDYGLSANYRWYGLKRGGRKPRQYHPGYWIASVEGWEQIPGTAHAIVMWGDQVRHDPNPLSRTFHEHHPYRFRGEWWFELGEPSAFLRAIAAR